MKWTNRVKKFNFIIIILCNPLSVSDIDEYKNVVYDRFSRLPWPWQRWPLPTVFVSIEMAHFCTVWLPRKWQWWGKIAPHKTVGSRKIVPPWVEWYSGYHGFASYCRACRQMRVVGFAQWAFWALWRGEISRPENREISKLEQSSRQNSKDYRLTLSR